MASGNYGDVQYGLPYTGTPVQQGSRDGVTKTVLNMQKLGTETITMHDDDDHYIEYVGPLYHE